jgi:Mrp family chromosome partitioning ATPase
MNERGLVDVPENALRDEPIAFGLTGVQLGICGLAVLVAAVLNLLPIWEPIRLIVVIVGAGPVFVAAALPIRGEPAYRWVARAVRYRRRTRVWRAENQAPDKSQLSGGQHDVAPDAESGSEPNTPFDQLGSSAMTGNDEPDRCSRALRAQEQAAMQNQRPRLRVVNDRAALDEPGQLAAHEPVPHLLGRLHIVCFMSFAGGVGKTTLAVEAATLVGSRARYRTLDGEVRPLRVLLLDAARTNPAAALRLGLDAETISKLLTRYDWPDPVTFEKRVVETRFGVTLLTLPQLPMQGLGPGLAFGPIEAAAILDAAEQAGFQLVVADLGAQLEEGHRHVIGQAGIVLGVVTPRIEALPDVLRITSYVRALGAGRKLGFVANQASDEGSLPALADGEQVPIVATIPSLEAFDAAGDRGAPAWTDDPEVDQVLQPLATAAWSLFPGVPSSRDHRLRGLVSTLRRLLPASGGRR